MGIEMIVLLVIAVLFGIAASLCANKCDHLEQDLRDARCEAFYWEHQHKKLTKALDESLGHCGEVHDYYS